MKGDADAELLSRGDPDSFAEFYGRHARRLAGWLMRATGDAEAAADLTAETFAAALVARKRYRPDRAAPTTWLYGIAAHKLADWQRRGYAEDRARRRLRMERIELSEDDVRELEYLAGEVAAVDLLEELPRRPARGAAGSAGGRTPVRRHRGRRGRLRSGDQATSEPRPCGAAAADEG